MKSLDERLKIAEENGIRIKAVVGGDYFKELLLEKFESESVVYVPNFGFLSKDQEGVYSVIVDPELEKQILKEYLIKKYNGRKGVFAALEMVVKLPLMLTKIVMEQQEKIEDEEVLKVYQAIK